MIQQINLYQPIFRTQRKVFSAGAMSQAIGVVIVALALLYGWGVWQTHNLQSRVLALQAQQTRASTTLERLEANLAARQPSAALTQALTAATQDRAARRALLETLSTRSHPNGAGFADLLAGLARTHVAGLWLTDIVLGNGGENISLAGATMRSSLVPELVRKLADAPAYAGVEFKRLQIRRDDEAHGRAHLSFLLSTTAKKGDEADAGAPAATLGAR